MTIQLSRAIIRLLDACVALSVIAFLSPLFAVVALALWSSRGNVLVRTPAVGGDGRHFVQFDFCRPTEAVRPLERLLVSTRLNSAPRLFNVVWGRLSMIGPPASIIEDGEKTITGNKSGLAWRDDDIGPLTAKRYLSRLGSALVDVLSHQDMPVR